MEQINIDIVPAGVASIAHASQFDTGRQIRFNLFNQGAAYTLTGAETVTMVVNGEEESITNTSDNYVVWDVADEDCEETGVIGCELRIVLGDMLIGSKNFFLEVEMDPYNGKGLRVVTVGPADICTFEPTISEPLVNVKCELPPSLDGYSAVNLTACGVNLLHVNSRVSQTTAQVIYTSDDNYITLNGTKSGGGFADMSNLTMTLPAGTYYLKAFAISGTASNTVSLYAYDGSNNISSDILGGEKTMTLATKKTFRFRFAIWTDGTVCTNYKIGIMVCATSGIDTFVEYTGNAYAIALGDTYYGGVLDVTRGKLHVTHGGVDLGSLSWLYNSTLKRFYARYDDGMPSGTAFGLTALCDTYPVDSANTYNNLPDNTMSVGSNYISGTVCAIVVHDETYTNDATFKTAMSGHYVVSELKTPFNIDLTPVQIEALAGVNNVYADCGQTELKYLTIEV